MSETVPARGAADAGAAADRLQSHLLDGVSRTFALTIPALPDRLRRPVANAYLLCRTLDTIEDEPGIGTPAKLALSQDFVSLVRDDPGDVAGFAAELGGVLTPATIPEEHELVAELPRVLAVTHSFDSGQRRPIERCVEVMASGMVTYQERASREGLEDVPDLDRYCYHVAGVVGELLTDLFAEYHPAVAGNRAELRRLSVQFGQGLQMTNILKDIWTDYHRGVCWLPKSVFPGAAVGLARALEDRADPRFAAGLERLVALSHGHLRAALDYVLLLPRTEPGMRRFCLYALGMAVLTLQRIRANPGFRDGDEVKISRRAVRSTVATVDLGARSNVALKLLFAAAGRGLPPTG